MQVRLSVAARNDYRKIATYLDEHCPAVTDRILDTLKFNLDRLQDHPMAGNKVGRYRKIQVVGTPYVVYYLLTTRELLVARIFHEKQKR
ncbi:MULTISPECIES: type II toxin-antitoxin system RelE/ParE family toxin [unclassified Endozoicomonas]|uniref:type II toxin-antitoxin system RelE/ParE family toxin n=1 Tax=unclassified Endozoicomonas TaxID=2644528 RepID=UPI002148D980|nr:MULTISPECIES: type II toxin-antitoxin system RelE/ParE family toxin [unclassified Endozoicomonas]